MISITAASCSESKVKKTKQNKKTAPDHQTIATTFDTLCDFAFWIAMSALHQMINIQKVYSSLTFSWGEKYKQEVNEKENLKKD